MSAAAVEGPGGELERARAAAAAVEGALRRRQRRQQGRGQQERQQQGRGQQEGRQQQGRQQGQTEMSSGAGDSPEEAEEGEQDESVAAPAAAAPQPLSNRQPLPNRQPLRGVMLVRNYRSAAPLLDLPSRLFYDTQLKVWLGRLGWLGWWLGLLVVGGWVVAAAEGLP